MSRVAHADFAEAHNNSLAEGRTLALIELVTPTSLDLRVGTDTVHTPDGNSWEVGLRCDPIRTRVDFLGSGPVLSSTTIYIANRQYAAMAAAVGKSMHEYLWQGAQVTIWSWFEELDDFSKALHEFTGRVDGFRLGRKELTLNLIQSSSWNVSTPPTIIDETNYPNAVDRGNSLPVPIFAGDFSSRRMRTPWASATANIDDWEEAGAGTGVVPFVVVDPGLGQADVKVVVACHEVSEISDHTAGNSTFIVAGDSLAPLDPASGITEVSGSSESYLTIDDDTLFAWYAVKPVDVRTGAGNNSASEPRRAMDPFDETSYATLDQTAGTDKEKLELILPNLGPLGLIDTVTVNIAFSGNAANTQNIRAYPRDSGDASTGSVVSAVSTSTSPGILSGTWDASYFDRTTWRFGESDTQAAVDLVVDFAGASASNKARIYWAIIKVRYKPSQSLVVPASSQTQVVGRRGRRPGQPFSPVGGQRGFAQPIIQTFETPALYEFGGVFYGNPKGPVDDGSGTYTGTAAALIQRPPDIASWFLQTFAGVSSGDITSGTDFGSFAAARDALRNGEPNDFKMAMHIGQVTNVGRVLEQIAAQCLGCFVLDRFTDQWQFHVWKRGRHVDYDETVYWRDMYDWELATGSDVDLIQGVRCRYLFDHFKGRTLYESFCTKNSSSQGLTLPTIRDQRLTVSASNDKYDWNAGGGSGNVTETLAHGTFTPMEIAADLRAAMRLRTNAGPTMHVGWSHSIRTGFNDRIDFQIGATVYDATLAEGDYSPEALAIEAGTKMTAEAGQTITVTYTHSTNKFQFSLTGTMTILGSTGTNYLVGAMLTLGVNQDLVVVTTGAANVERYSRRFWEANKSVNTFNLLYGSGTNVATNAAYLLGHPKGDTGFTSNTTGAYSRGDQERAIDALEQAYRPKEDKVLTLDWIRDENSATSTRDRLLELNQTPPHGFRTKTRKCCDLQVMRAIPVDTEMDEQVGYPRYGSDGSFQDKVFLVLETEKHLGPERFTEFLAIEV